MGWKPVGAGGGEILIESGVVKEVSDHSIRSESARAIDGRDGFLMPGLIDCHLHVTISEVDLRKLAFVPLTMMTALAAQNMRETLMRGFTTVRDCAGADRGLAMAVDSGLFLGPRLFQPGRALTQTGGHGDFRAPDENHDASVNSNAISLQSVIADGITEVRRAARNELRKGADFIKVMVSGGVASPTDPIDNAQYSLEELRAIVEEAAAWNTYVAAHAYTSHAAMNAVKSGIRTIEHGNLIDRATAELMAKSDAYLVPTLATYDILDKFGKELGLPRVSIEKLQIVKDAGIRAVEHCRAAGTKIGFGTDLLGNLRDHQSSGFALQAQAQTPREVLTSATLVNAEILNQSGKIGEISPGAIADLIVVEGDPLAEIGILEHQGRYISAIMKDGEFVKCELD